MYAETTVLENPFVVGVALIIVTAVLGGAGAMVLLLRDVRVYVLPHYVPPKPGEPDLTIPARMARNEEQVTRIAEDIAPTNGDRSSISSRIDKAKKVAEAVHVELENYKREEADDRQIRRAYLDQKLDEGSGRFADIDEKLGQLATQLPDVLAGNPEVHRPVPPTG